MKTPRYSDMRYPHGYKPAAQTDIRRTFNRVRAEQKAAAEREAENLREAEQKVRGMRKASGK